MRPLAVLSFILFSAAMTASAQTALTVEVKEDFATSVNVSGTVITGLMIGSQEVPDPSRLTFRVEETSKVHACLQARTRDGQYWAESVFDIPAKQGAVFTISPRDGWRHLSKLSKYGENDFAALLRIGKDCDIAADAPLVPVFAQQNGPRKLRVVINSQRAIRLSAELESVNGATHEAHCAKPDIRTIRSTAFDYICTFETFSEGGGVLTLRRRMRTSNMTDRYEVHIPALD